MKPFFALLVPFALFAPLAHAGSGGPDAHGYTWVDQADPAGPVNQLVAHTSAAEEVLANNAIDNALAVLDVLWGGIYGKIYSTFRVSRDGYLSSFSVADPTPDCPLPATPAGIPAGLRDRIYVHHQDLVGGTVHYERFEHCPHPHSDGGVHVFTWENVQQASGDATPFTVQALLFDNLDILIQYGAMPSSNTFTVGIQNANASIGLAAHCGAGSSPPKSGAAILFVPPVLTVDTAANQFDTPSGAELSLREAVRDAISGTRIEFDPGTFSFNTKLELSGLTNIEIDGKTIAIDASALDQPISFDGGQLRRHFTVENGGYLALSNFSMWDGRGQGSRPGSMWVDDGATLLASRCTWDSNASTVALAQGGAINADQNASVFLRECDFLNNHSQRFGGAISLEGARLDAWQCRFRKNSAHFSGGAISTDEVFSGLRSDIDLRECDFTLNESVQFGGALNLGRADADMRSCTFDDNRAGLTGGAVRATTGAPGAVSFIDFIRCTFYGNRAMSGGGAISYTGAEPGSAMTINSSTIFRNDGGTVAGALLISDTDILIKSSIIADNYAGLNNDQIAIATGGTGQLLDIGFNVETGSEGGFAVSNVTDIGLSDLGHFGGFVRTCTPLAPSPVIGAGEVFAPDARGFPLNFPPDAGAVEVAPIHMVTTSTGTGAGSLQAALDSVAADGGVIRFDDIDLVEGSGVTLPDAPVLIEGPVIIDGLSADLPANASLALHGCRLRGGGAAYAIEALVGGHVTLDHCALAGYMAAANNRAVVRGRGADMSISSSRFSDNVELIQCENVRGDTFFRDSVVTHNIGGEEPLENFESGAIRTFGGFTAIQRSSVIDNEFSYDTGGTSIIGLFGATGGHASAVLENSTIARNTIDQLLQSVYVAVRLGGGSGNRRQTAEILHCTITDNTSHRENDTGIWTPSLTNLEFSMINSIVAGHTNANFAPSTATFSNGGNLSDTTIPGAQPSDLENTDPMLSAAVLGRNGTLHFYPRIGSPAIDAGISPNNSSLDGRGGHREVNSTTGALGGTPDIGAAESGGRLTVTTATDENNGGLGLGAGDSLREVIDAAEALDGGSIDFAPAVHGSLISLTTGISLDDVVVDIDGLEAGISLERSGTQRIFNTIDDAALSLHGIELDSAGGTMMTRGRTFVTLHACKVTGGEALMLIAEDTSHLRLSSSWLEGNGDTDLAVFAREGGHIEMIDSAVSGGESLGRVIEVNDTARFTARGTTFARNACAIHSFNIYRTAEARLDGCTITRNGAQFGLFNSAYCFLRDNVLHNNAKPVTFDGNAATQYISLGGNKADTLEPVLDHPDDRTGLPIFLSPIADYDGDGAAETPAQAVDRNLFVGDIEMQVQNATDDSGFSFRGHPDKSMRQTIRFAEDGEVVTFNPDLSGSTITTVVHQLLIENSITIDASALPDGITIDGTAEILVSGDVTVCFVGIQFENRNNGATTGGGIRSINGANLIFDRCTFSGNSASFGGAIAASGGSVFAQNCTFNGNSASSRGGAVFLQSLARATFEHCTFDGNDAAFDGGAISGNGASHVAVYGCAFADNLVTSSSKLGNIEMVSTGTAESLGYNIFSDIPAFALASDATDALPELGPSADNGGPVDTQLPDGAGSNSVDFLPAIATGNVPPPWVDARGYPRVIASSADAGATENGADSLDSDGDMIPDWWETFYGLTYLDSSNATANEDGDDGDDLTEFLNDSNPLEFDLDLADAPVAIAISTSQAVNGSTTTRLDWFGEAGFAYQYQISQDLENWSNVAAPVTATGGTQSSFVGSSSPRVFVRVIVAP